MTDDEVLDEARVDGFELIERMSAGRWAVGWARGADDRWRCFLEERQAINGMRDRLSRADASSPDGAPAWIRAGRAQGGRARSFETLAGQGKERGLTGKQREPDPRSSLHCRIASLRDGDGAVAAQRGAAARPVPSVRPQWWSVTFRRGARRVSSTFGKLALELSWTSAAQRSASEVPVESIEFSLEAEASAPGAARRFLRRALATQNLDGFGDVSELLTTELVTNVVLHARSPITVRLLTSGDRLRVEVDDASNKALVPQPADPERPSGKGLLLVDKLASDWGVDTRADGKTVWFEIDTSTATDEIHGDSP